MRVKGSSEQETSYRERVKDYISIKKKKKKTGRSQDGGGIGRGEHFLFYKLIERTTER